MNWTVKWSPAARDEYARLLQYLEQEYGTDSALKFLEETDAVLSQISRFPNSGTPTKKERIRKSMITKQTSLFYELYEKEVRILHFWDNRQDPNKLD